MARRLVTELIDDIDSKPIKEGAGQHISFGVDGVEYEIDLGDKNAKEFYRKLDYYIQHGTKVGSKNRRSSGRATTADAKRSPAEVRAIRDWAKKNGYEIADRGRIPTEVEHAYNAAR